MKGLGNPTGYTVTVVEASSAENDVPHFRGGPAIYEVDGSTLPVADFYFLEPGDRQPDLVALGDPVPVPVG